MMKCHRKNQVLPLISLLLGIVLIGSCGGVNSVYYDNKQCVFGLDSARTGADLYSVSCASCHNPLASSSKRGRGASQISNAISQNRGGMSFLSCLTTAQIREIAEVLKD